MGDAHRPRKTICIRRLQCVGADPASGIACQTVRGRTRLAEKGSDESIAATTIKVPVNLCRRGQEVQILTCDGTPNEAAPAPDPVLVGAMIRAYRWRNLLESGAAKSVEWISRTEHVNASYLAKLLSLPISPRI